MLFNSLHFLLFFPIVIAVYFLIPFRYRWIFLLAASYYFYMAWKVEYVLLIIFSTLVDYFAAIMMGKTDNKSKRKKYLIVSLVSNLGLLFIFKYFNFFNESTQALLTNFNIFYGSLTFKLLLPVGISFYTFQTLSYTIDVYRGKRKPEKHLGIFAVYVSFFPQLVAGPIERSTSLLPQFYKKYYFNCERTVNGLSLMLWGFFKKIVIADNVARVVNIVYDNPEGFQGIHFIIATFLFAFQIFCDFSGYSDIAIGTAKIMGFDLMKNFKRPYFAVSIADFWQRWHISLSTWFRDYLYIPLGGNRNGKKKMYFYLMTTFVVSGLWHGANWTFIVWGFIHGLYLIFGKITKKLRVSALKYTKIEKIPFLYKLLQIFTVFTLVCFSWIFFRANTLSDALYIASNIFSGLFSFIVNINNFVLVKNTLGSFAVSPLNFSIMFISIAFLVFVHILKGDRSIRKMLINKPIYIRWGFYYFLILGLLFFGNYGQQPFIYFQF